MKGVRDMANVHDVAAYILEKRGPMSAMKLEKLVYYSQAWSLVWDQRPMFNEEIQAWIGGPVVPELFAEHKGAFELTKLRKGDVANLDSDAIETIDVVLRDYGGRTGLELSELTHSEKPWIEARRGLADNERGNHIITQESMQQFYTCIYNEAYA
jgi:uncharacterized phage-associated protein